MYLRDLPLEAMRPILMYCDLQSLIALYSTFDSRIQRMLRSRMAIPLLDLEPLRVLPRGPARYLVRSLQHIERLELPHGAEWSPSSLPLFSSLNPSELCFGEHLIHPSAQALYFDAQRAPSDSDESRLIALMKPLGFPNLPLLTPRLHTLELRSSLPRIWSHSTMFFTQIELPSTLTSLIMPHISILPSEIILLPPALTHLDFATTSREAAYNLMQHLTSLESLSLLNNIDDYTPSNTLSYDHVRAPVSLTRLKWSSKYFPNFLFDSPLLERCTRLVHLDLVCALLIAAAKLVDASKAILPASIRSLTFKLPQAAQASQVLPMLPFSLTELSLTVLNQRMLDQVAQAPTSLTKLTLKQQRKPLALLSLPQTLRNLSVTLNHSLSAREIENLPPLLTELHVSSLELSDLEALRARAPACRVYISNKIMIGESKTVLGEKFKSLASPVLDVQAVHRAIDLYAMAEKLNFCFGVFYTASHFVGSPKAIEFHPPLPSDTLTGQAATWCDIAYFITNAVNSYRELERLSVDGLDLMISNDSILSTLTRMDLGSCLITLKALPPSLTHLTSSATVDATRLSLERAPLKLSVLNAPNWTFSARYLDRCIFKDCIELKCGITHMNDYDVIPFLTRKISPKTRLNMSVSISAFATGAMILDDGENGPKVLKLDTLERLTPLQLELELQAPMPLLEGQTLDGAGSSNTIGTGVSSIQCRDPDNLQDELMIPCSATSVRYHLLKPWKLVPNLRHAAPSNAKSSIASLGPEDATQISPPISSPSLQPPPYFSPSNVLTHLELIGVSQPSIWWEHLPHSLKVIRLSSASILELPGVFPPCLETLILEDELSIEGRTLAQSDWSFPSKIDSKSPSFSLAQDKKLSTQGVALKFSLTSLPSTLKDLVIIPPRSFVLNEKDSLNDLPYCHMPALRRVVFGDLRCWGANMMKLLPLAQLTLFKVVTHNSPLDSMTFALAPDDPISPSGNVELTYTRKFDSSSWTTL